MTEVLSVKVDKAVEKFRQDEISVWKGAAMAELSLRQFIETLDERRVDWVGISMKELEAEIQAIEKETH